MEVIVRCNKCGQCMEIASLTFSNGELEIELHEHECEE